MDASSRSIGGFALAVSVAVAAASLTHRSLAGQVSQANTYKAPRLADGRPNLNGIWQALNTANYDIQAHVARGAMAMRPGPVVPVPAREVLYLGAVGSVPGGMGIVEGDEIPYKPEALAKKKENQEKWLERDPEITGARPRDQVLPPRRAARDLHALSVPDLPESKPDVHRV